MLYFYLLNTWWSLFQSLLIVKSISGPMASTTTFQLRGVSAKPLYTWSIKMHIFIPTFHYFSSLNIGCWPLPLPLIYTHRAVNPQSHLFHLGCFHITVIISEIFKNFSFAPFLTFDTEIAKGFISGRNISTNHQIELLFSANMLIWLNKSSIFDFFPWHTT